MHNLVRIGAILGAFFIAEAAHAQSFEGEAPAATLRGNQTSARALAKFFSIQGLPARGGPDATNDQLLIYDAAAGMLKRVSPGQIASSATAGVSSLNGLSGALVQWAAPQGRMTLASNTPVMTASYSAQTTAFYTAYIGKNVPIYNGTAVATYQICSPATVGACELSVAMGANFTANSNFDGFVGLNSGVVTFCFGPAWTSDTARGSGAGTTELEPIDGLQTNKNSMTCRYANASTFTCAAHQCSYVGTMRTGSAGQSNYVFGAVGAGGVAGNFGIWNMYNRVPVRTMVGDSADTWTYGVDGVWRAANNSATIRVSAIRGFDQDGITARYHAIGFAGAGAVQVAGVGLNGTTAFCGSTQYNSVAANVIPLTASCTGLMGLGYAYVAAIEYNVTATASTWVGDAGSATWAQTGLHVELAQ